VYLKLFYSMLLLNIVQVSYFNIFKYDLFLKKIVILGSSVIGHDNLRYHKTSCYTPKALEFGSIRFQVCVCVPHDQTTSKFLYKTLLLLRPCML